MYSICPRCRDKAQEDQKKEQAPIHNVKKFQDKFEDKKKEQESTNEERKEEIPRQDGKLFHGEFLIF